MNFCLCYKQTPGRRSERVLNSGTLCRTQTFSQSCGAVSPVQRPYRMLLCGLSLWIPIFQSSRASSGCGKITWCSCLSSADSPLAVITRGAKQSCFIPVLSLAVYLVAVELQTRLLQPLLPDGRLLLIERGVGSCSAHRLYKTWSVRAFKIAWSRQCFKAWNF